MAEVALVVALKEHIIDTDDGDEDNSLTWDENLVEEDEDEEDGDDEMQPASLPESSGSLQRRGRMRDLRRRQCINVAFVGATLLILVVLEAWRSDRFGGKGNENTGGPYEEYEMRMKSQSDYNTRTRPSPITSIVPDQLLGTLYQPSDFVNERGVVPTFWHYDLSNSASSENNTSSNTPTANTTIAPTTVNALQITPEFNHKGIPSWGPCYPPRRATSSSINWQQEISRAKQLEPEHEYRRNRDAIAAGIDNMCRPGFIIIGAGKCGTSSLYHYLTGHPRVLPAYSKQIHYFVYYAKKPLSWYYSWFPTTTNFLASGALMTGEASPGYLPYPDVAKLLHTSLPDPKIIMVGRNPLERSWSSYKYNYVAPTLEEMALGHVKDMPMGRTKDYYKSFLFTFEELMRAELEQLKKCLDPIHGFGANATRSLWGKRKWTQPELDRRMSNPNEKTGELQPLIDLDGVCYGKRINRTVLLEQWAELQTKQPHKVMLERNIHLKQSLIGRSLYVFPLEWWYLMYKPEDIHFLCTEELSDLSGRPLNEMAANHLGLPWFNFSSVVAEGVYNVGDNRGYDQATSWEEVAKSENEELPEQKDGNAATVMGEDDDVQNGSKNSIVTEGSQIPLSIELLQDLQEFVLPINERLFDLVGRRCIW